MPKFHVVGADRDSGEDIEMTIEADAAAEARAKANRRGVLVAGCTPVSPHMTRPADRHPREDRRVPAVPTGDQRPTRTGSRMVRLSAIVVGALVVVVAVVYFAVLRPQHERMQQTLTEAVAQTEKTEAMSRELAQQQIKQVPQETHTVEPAGKGQTDGQPATTVQATAALRKYLLASEAFVREIKALRSRVSEGANYSQFTDKLGNVGDEYAQMEAPPDDPDAAAFTTAAAAAMENYRQADRRWASAIRNNLWLAEKYNIREMFQSADTQVSTMLTRYNGMKVKVGS